MSFAQRRVGGGIIGGYHESEVSASDQAKIELLELGQSGFRIFTQRDLMWDYRPWLVAKDDRSIWTLEGGMPLSGYRPTTNAVLVGKNNTWAYLTSVAASGIGNAPRDLAELERRARKADEEAERAAAAHDAKLAALRAAAVPVTLGDIEPGLRVTVRAAAERIDQAGGTVELDGGRLVVSLPPGANTFGPDCANAARVLYVAEDAVVAALKADEPLPDKPITPAGAVLA
jgi:hypothetical protein